MEDAIEAMADLGATIVDPVDYGDPFEWFGDEFTVPLQEFKVDIAAYLATLRRTRMRTLADLIQFNLDSYDAELTYLDQSVFEAAEATNGVPDPPPPLGLCGNTAASAGAGDEARKKIAARRAPPTVLSRPAACRAQLGIRGDGDPEPCFERCARLLVLERFEHVQPGSPPGREDRR